METGPNRPLISWRDRHAGLQEIDGEVSTKGGKRRSSPPVLASARMSGEKGD